MKGEDLLRAMTEIEDRYILEADPTAGEEKSVSAQDGAGHRRTPRAAWASAIALAAVLLLAFVGGRSWMRHGGSSISTGPSTGAGIAYEEAAVTEEAMEMEEEAEEESAFDVAEETADYAAAESVKEESAERGDNGGVQILGSSSGESADVVTAQIYGREVLYRRVEHPAEALEEAGIRLTDDTDLSELAFQIPGTEDWYGIASLPDERLLLHMEEGEYVLYEAAE